ncbi:hypothetical protein SUGI_0595540 [Cryptomeria japonica]|uniref:disease resistance protein Roq1-like n=1 Tax=Cryptomeria japonica TaxID=3369 RepID=UPI002414AE06|nr:disease resistance protein Roq1-like [Cryptomeria japonica]GLJ30112.1 hypothetical protein SUGI_0595540 [Cryptomeria japonica]
MASSSSAIACPKLYDAFISHRGPDVKETLAKHLYHLLRERGCQPFLDRPEIQVGDSIPFALSNAICSSIVQIAIFSPGYAESSWCLDELVLMLEQQPDALFIPVFYNVQPWELRHIENEKSQYAEAFSNYERRGRYPDKLDEWRRALKSAADISGFELSQHQDNLCENIVSHVLQVVQERKNRISLDVAKYPIGLAELVEDFESCLERRRHERPKTMDKVTIAGIYGLGGSGKTTLAKELFNRKCSGYHASSFLSDVRESHARGILHHLQSQLLKDLFSKNREIEDLKIRSVDHGIVELKKSLERARQLHFLMVLDDIDHLDQLDALLPQGTLSSRSLVIITTRDKNMLRDADICYKMKVLEGGRAKDLFCSHAFRGQDTPVAYAKLVESFVKFCGGLPLSLKVLGAHLYGKKEYYWGLELEKVKKIQPKGIMERLKISFDGLDQEEKQIFIDIACFFNKRSYGADLKNMAITIWNASGWSAEHALQTLQDKSLVEIKWDEFQRYDHSFEMHDHLSDLGRQMADELGPPRLWRPQSLRSMEAKGFEQILAETKVRCFNMIHDSSLDVDIDYFIGSSNDSADTDLLGLHIRGLKEIPSWIPLQKLRFLKARSVEEIWSRFDQLSRTNKASFELRELVIVACNSSQKIPDLIGMFCHLEKLEILYSLKNTDITSLSESIKRLSNLRSLKLKDYSDPEKLDVFSLEASTSSCATSLETIYIDGLFGISKLLISGEICPRLRSMEVYNMWNLKEMDLKHLSGLHELHVSDCVRLKSLPSLSHQRHLQQFTIAGCYVLESVEGFEELQELQSLIVEVPHNGLAWVKNRIYGLKRLPSHETILVGMGADATSSRLDVSLFSEVTGIQALVEIERGEHSTLHSSSNAITIYAFLGSEHSDRSSMKIASIDIYDEGERMITVLLPHHNSEGIRLSNINIEKGFKAIVNKGEEKKALILMQRIVDQLYV